jgi:hypothetical protein
MMREVKLANEQIEAAAKAMRKADHCPIDIGHYRITACAAAPFLQMPWEMPTYEELEMFKDFKSAGSALFEFVRRRNAALLPKPVDPRRQRIIDALAGDVVTADRILVALDTKDGVNV